MPRNLPPRIQSHIARAHRRRFIAASLFVTCLIAGTGAALAHTQLPHQLAATLKPIASELSTQFAQLPSALTARMPDIDLQLPAQQLAAAGESATSFPSYIASKVRNLFCRWLGCDATEFAATSTSRISNDQLTNIGAQQPTTKSQNVKPAELNTARSATTTPVVVSNSSNASAASSNAAPASASPASNLSPASAQPPERIIERILALPDTTYVDARLAALEVSIAERIAAMDNANATSFRSASSGSSPSSVAASTISGTITNAIDTATAAIASLTATEFVATNATTTNATTTNLYVSGRASLPTTNVSGDLTVSGTISGGTLAVSGLSSGGAIEAPYFTATSSTASSFPYASSTALTVAGTAYFPGSGIWNSSGNVGIGTTGPDAKLDVAGALHLGQSTDLGAAKITHHTNNYLYVTGGTAGAVLSDDGFVNTARVVDGAAGYFSVETGDGTERLRVNASGNVGIGETSPNNKLTVKSSGTNTRVIQAAPSTGSGEAYVYEDGDGDFQLWMENSAGTANVALNTNGVSYLNGGNIGIGTTTPNSKLSVVTSGGSIVDIAEFSNSTLGSTAGVNLKLGNSSGLSTSGGYAAIQAGRFDSNDRGLRLIARGNNEAVAPASIHLDGYSASTGGTIRFNTSSSINSDGSERMRVDLNGNVGIASTSPWAKLSLTNTGTGPSFLVEDATSPDTSPFIIDTDGQVGIGTTTPGTKLHVYSTLAGNGQLFVDDGSGKIYFGRDANQGWINVDGSDKLVLRTNNTDKLTIESGGNVGIGTTSPQARLEVSSSGTGSLVRFYLDGDRGLLDAQSGNIGFRNKSTNIASIDGYTGAGGSINYGQLVFSTANAGSLIERMRITESGNVGIGTTSPTSKLHVVGAANVENGGTASTFAEVLRFSRPSFPTSYFHSIYTKHDSNVANDDLQFRLSDGSATGQTTVLTLNGGGNVGIGTTTPDSVLQVFRLTHSAPVTLHIENDGYLEGASAQLLLSAKNTSGGQQDAAILNDPDGSTNGSRLLFQTGAGASPSTRMVIDKDGNVGIGTTSPDAALTINRDSQNFTALKLTRSGSSPGSLAFDVQTSGTGILTADAQLQFKAGTSYGVSFFDGSDTNLTIQGSTGNVGIGTTTPNTRLTVSAAAGGTLRIESTNTDTNNILYFTSPDSSASINLGRSGLAQKANALNLEAAGDINFYPGGAGQGTERLVLDSSGNVGIGTTSPGARLHVSAIDVGETWTASAGTTGLFESSGGSVLSLVGGSSAQTELWFGDEASQSPGRVRYDHTVDALSLWSNSSQRLTITSTGNIGIGTTTPSYPLSVKSFGTLLTLESTTNTAFLRYDNNSTNAVLGLTNSDYTVSLGGSERLRIGSSGNVGIGTTSPMSGLSVVAPSGSNANTATFQYGSGSAALRLMGNSLSTQYLYFGSLSSTTQGVIGYDNTSESFIFRTNGGGTTRLLIDSSGRVGIGTTTAWRTLSVSGTVGFDGLTGTTGAGSLCLDANKQVVYNAGSDACLSSTRATKHDIQPLSLNALGLIEGLEPVSFVYNESNDRTRFGFIAEDTAAIDPHLATYNASGTVSGIDDRAILSILVAAIQDLIEEVRGLTQAIAHFAESFTTKELAFDRAYGHELTVDKLCVGQVCVTESQFMAVFGQTAGAAASVSVPSSPSNPSEPEATTTQPDLTQTEENAASDLTNSEGLDNATSTSEAIEPEADDAQSEEEVSSPSPANDNEPASVDQPTIAEPANDNPAPPSAQEI